MELEFVEKFLNLLSTYIFLLKNLKLEEKVPGIGRKFLEKFFEQPSFILYSPDTKSRFETWAKIFGTSFQFMF